MTIYFLDSSALVKRYVAEKGSAWFHSLSPLPRETTLVVSRITWVEVCSSLARLARETYSHDQTLPLYWIRSNATGTINIRLSSLTKTWLVRQPISCSAITCEH